MQYEDPGSARFSVSRVEGREWLRIPARRNWFVLLFLCFWLTMWTVGGFAAITALSAGFSLFLLVWLGGWALGWLFAAATILWQLGGSEALSVVSGDLHYVVRLPGYRKLRVYRGGEIADVAARATALPAMYMMQPSYPPLFNARWGSACFRYGARTIYLAPGLDEAEGRMIAEWLLARLPRRAGQG